MSSVTAKQLFRVHPARAFPTLRDRACAAPLHHLCSFTYHRPLYSLTSCLFPLPIFLLFVCVYIRAVCLLLFRVVSSSSFYLLLPLLPFRSLSELVLNRVGAPFRHPLLRHQQPSRFSRCICLESAIPTGVTRRMALQSRTTNFLPM